MPASIFRDLIMKNMKSVKGFTLIELLVVIAIISLLLAIVMPAFAKVKGIARRVISLSNTRQWGIGVMSYTTEYNEALPWEGDKTDLSFNFTRSDWWANAIPPMLGQKPYNELSEDGQVPIPPEKSIFTCPSAKVPDNAPYPVTGTNPQPWNRFFFCYVWNSDLNEGRTSQTVDDIDPVKLSKIRRASSTVFLVEMRTIRDELDEDDEFYDKDLNRHRADWKRFAARHRKGSEMGGHMAYCDGHADFVSNEYATTNAQGSRNPNYPKGDWNKADLIWNPFGPAPD